MSASMLDPAPPPDHPEVRSPSSSDPVRGRDAKATPEARPVTSEPDVLNLYQKQVRSFRGDRLRKLHMMLGIAWTVAIAAGVVAGAEGFAVAHLVNRPMPKPIVLRVDNATGMVDQIHDVDGGPMEASEAEARHWLWQYVRAAESYNAPEAPFNFQTVMLMSTPPVQEAYAKRVNAPNPESPAVVLGRDGQAQLNWVSTTFIGRNLAQVRFTKVEMKGTNLLPRRSLVATVAYSFTSDRISASTININPRGFLVTSYHVDQENAQ